MFGKLKNMAANSAVQKIVDKIAPGLRVKLESTLSKVSPSAISHDESFEKNVIKPIKLGIMASTSGAAKLLPGFDKKFDTAMLHLRDELIVADVDNNKVTLVEGFDAKLPEVLKSGFEKVKKSK